MRFTIHTRRQARRLAVALTTISLLGGLGTTPALADCGDPVKLLTDDPETVTDDLTAPDISPETFDPCLTVPLDAAGRLLDAAGGPPCTYVSTDITIGELSADVITDLDGDIYYRWSAPSNVRNNGDCDHATVSYVTYTDTPVAGAGKPEASRPFRKQESGQVTVSQAPEWDVRYYGLNGLYIRTLQEGKFTMLVEGTLIYKGIEHRTGKCMQKTWFFTATPAGPRITHSLTQQVRCPGYFW